MKLTDITAALEIRSMTSTELREHIGLSKPTVVGALQKLMLPPGRCVRIESYRKSPGPGAWTRCMALDQDQIRCLLGRSRAPSVTVTQVRATGSTKPKESSARRMRKSNGACCPRLNHGSVLWESDIMPTPTFSGWRSELYIERLIAALSAGPMTCAALAAKMHRSGSGVAEYLVHLMESPKRVYIVAFAPAMGRGRRAAIFAVGSKSNAPEERQTRTESHKSRKKRDPDAHAKHLASRRAKRAERNAKAAPQSWASALGL